MVAPFRFLDRVDALVGGPESVLASVRALVLPGGDRPVTRASNASRISADSVRAHVVGVALDVVTERVREGLVAALSEHLAAVREEYELLEGECPDDPETTGWEWRNELANEFVMSLLDSDVLDVLKSSEVMKRAIGDAQCRVEGLADAVLAAPVDDPTAVLARAGVTPAALDAVVDEVRRSHRQTERQMEAAEIVNRHPVISAALHRAEIAEAGWTAKALGQYLRGARVDASLVEEGAAYVLTDADMVDTGAELLGLAGDAAFLEWARDRLVFSTPEEDAAAVAEVLRLAGATEEGGDAIATGSQDAKRQRAETAAGADEEAAPAAQVEFAPEVRALIDSGEAVYLEPENDAIALREKMGAHKIIIVPVPRTPRQVRGSTAAWTAARKVLTTRGDVLKDVAAPREEPPVAAEPSDLTRAVSAALAAMFDHGCESDKAMAAALGVERSVVAGARRGTTPWAPEGALVRQLHDMIHAHAGALERARNKLEAFT